MRPASSPRHYEYQQFLKNLAHSTLINHPSELKTIEDKEDAFLTLLYLSEVQKIIDNQEEFEKLVKAQQKEDSRSQNHQLSNTHKIQNLLRSQGEDIDLQEWATLFENFEDAQKAFVMLIYPYREMVLISQTDEKGFLPRFYGEILEQLKQKIEKKDTGEIIEKIKSTITEEIKELKQKTELKIPEIDWEWLRTNMQAKKMEILNYSEKTYGIIKNSFEKFPEEELEELEALKEKHQEKIIIRYFLREIRKNIDKGKTTESSIEIATQEMSRYFTLISGDDTYDEQFKEIIRNSTITNQDIQKYIAKTEDKLEELLPNLTEKISDLAELRIKSIKDVDITINIRFYRQYKPAETKWNQALGRLFSFINPGNENYENYFKIFDTDFKKTQISDYFENFQDALSLTNCEKIYIVEKNSDQENSFSYYKISKKDWKKEQEKPDDLVNTPCLLARKNAEEFQFFAIKPKEASERLSGTKIEISNSALAISRFKLMIKMVSSFLFMVIMSIVSTLTGKKSSSSFYDTSTNLFASNGTPKLINFKLLKP